MNEKLNDRLGILLVLVLFVIAYLGGKYVFSHTFNAWSEVIIGALILTCVVMMWEMLLAHPPEGDFPEA